MPKKLTIEGTPVGMDARVVVRPVTDRATKIGAPGGTLDQSVTTFVTRPAPSSSPRRILLAEWHPPETTLNILVGPARFHFDGERIAGLSVPTKAPHEPPTEVQGGYAVDGLPSGRLVVARPRESSERVLLQIPQSTSIEDIPAGSAQIAEMLTKTPAGLTEVSVKPEKRKETTLLDSIIEEARREREKKNAQYAGIRHISLITRAKAIDDVIRRSPNIPREENVSRATIKKRQLAEVPSTINPQKLFTSMVTQSELPKETLKKITDNLKYRIRTIKVKKEDGTEVVVKKREKIHYEYITKLL